LLEQLEELWQLPQRQQEKMASLAQANLATLKTESMRFAQKHRSSPWSRVKASEYAIGSCESCGAKMHDVRLSTAAQQGAD